MNVTDLIKKKLEKAVTREQAEEAIKVMLCIIVWHLEELKNMKRLLSQIILLW